MREELVILAETASHEDSRVDFKSDFHPQDGAAFWAEIVKDIVAMTNSLGGVSIFGTHDDGCENKEFLDTLSNFDPAKISDQINKYTQVQFNDFFIFTAVRPNGNFPTIGVLPNRMPIVFVKPGLYTVDGKNQKRAFSQGTIYFRHGAKSETGTRDDLRDAFYRELDRFREEWFSNMRRVVEAEPGATIVVQAPSEIVTDVRLSRDPNSPAVRVRELSATHPYRQSELIKKVRSMNPKIDRLNSHDIMCIRKVERIDPVQRPDLIHKPHEKSSPQYSENFAKFISEKFAANNNYFTECRAEYQKVAGLGKSSK